MQTSDYICSALASLMWSESHEDNLQGLVAAGLVVRNRVLAGWGDYIEIISKHNQWAASPKELKLGDIRDPLFLRVLTASQTIYCGQERDITFGALWYCRLNEAPDIFVEKIVRKVDMHPRTAQIGRTVYFK